MAILGNISDDFQHELDSGALVLYVGAVRGDHPVPDVAVAVDEVLGVRVGQELDGERLGHENRTGKFDVGCKGLVKIFVDCVRWSCDDVVGDGVCDGCIEVLVDHGVAACAPLCRMLVVRCRRYQWRRWEWASRIGRVG